MRQRRHRAFKRGWVALYILGVGGIGALASGWNGLPRTTGLSAAQMVALRFPEETEELPAPDGPESAGIVAGTQLALLTPSPVTLTPSPVAGQTAIQSEPVPLSPPPELHSSSPQPDQSVVPLPRAAHHTAPHLKPAAAPVHKVANRPGFVLNDAQIASIKQRLQLTPDQEQMWPAVEAALRSIAYAKAHGEAHRRGLKTATELANVDPNSPEVQGLKSAAFPLIMSFNSEQKSEVRTLAHVMGLDQLASQF
jgi:hypothetical protein